MILDIRHAEQYADELRLRGADAIVSRSVLSYLVAGFTFGSVRIAVVTGQKRTEAAEHTVHAGSGWK